MRTTLNEHELLKVCLKKLNEMQSGGIPPRLYPEINTPEYLSNIKNYNIGCGLLK